MYQLIYFLILGLFLTFASSESFKTFPNYGSFIMVELKIAEADFSEFNFTLRCSEGVHNYHQTWTITAESPHETVESVLLFNRIFKVPEVTIGAICYGEHNFEPMIVNIRTEPFKTIFITLLRESFWRMLPAIASGLTSGITILALWERLEREKKTEKKT